MATVTKDDNGNSHVVAPIIRFEEPEDEHDVVIPDGHAACLLKDDDVPARVDCPAGSYRFYGTSFDRYDAPFIVVVLPMEYASAVSRLNRAVDLTETKSS